MKSDIEKEGEGMKIKKEDRGGMTRREFLYRSGAGMAGMALAGIPERGYAQGSEKSPSMEAICG